MLSRKYSRGSEELTVIELELLETSAVSTKFTNRWKLLWHGHLIWLVNLFQQRFVLSSQMDRILKIIESFACVSSPRLLHRLWHSFVLENE